MYSQVFFGECCHNVLLWGSRNVVWTAELPPTFHPHGGEDIMTEFSYLENLSVKASVKVKRSWKFELKALTAETIWTLHVAYLLVVGKTSHDGWVHDPVQQHGEGVDGQVGIVEMPLHHAADLLIGQLHRFHGVLQWTDLLLRGTGSEGVIRYSQRFQYLLYTQYITTVSVIQTIERKYLRSVTRDTLLEDGAQENPQLHT